MKTLSIPANEATQRLEQAFQLVFSTSTQEYSQLCNTFSSLGGLPRAWIVKGESGTGKTYLANVLCKKYGVERVVTVTIGDLAIMYPGDLLKGLTTYLRSSRQFSKTVVILDNIELIFPRDDSNFSLVYAFQSWIQELKDQENLSLNSVTTNISHGRVVVLGLTQDVRALDPSVATLFDDSIELDIPTPEERSVILQASAVNHQMTGQLDFASELEAVSQKCHGYLPADLDALCTQAAVIAHGHGRGLNNCSKQDFYDGMKAIRVSALRQNTSVQKVDPVYWSDIGGLEHVKKTLEESVIWLYKHAEAYSRMGISPSKGVLLYGPPGTGKTLLAKAVATESEANFMAVSIPELIKGEVGESEKAIAKVFRTASKCSPCIVFLDELEAIFGTRESSGGLGKQLISQLLLEMDGCPGGVVILAATNHPEAIDNSILRPGRLDRLVYVPPPTLEERIAILRILKNSTRFSDTTDLYTVGNLTSNFTGADMKALVRKAGLYALKDNRTQIESRDFFAATSDVQPSVNQFGLLRYEQFRRK
ncbi:AAA-domain-containing protein [Linnemannia elongata AG-77]|uniref:AAA-domain-containing protein n=1 Tax=Linnemannia elongata AG-77 TaxID=1314771 RepID=A0A197KA98_9FUNG|nr:AAA-domain-containing protein [Linnemannia elongata AG-77]